MGGGGNTGAHTHNRLSLPSFFLGADFSPSAFFPWPFRSSGGAGAKLPLPRLKAHMNTGRFLGRRRRRYKKIKGFLFLLLRLLLRIIGRKEREEEEHLLCQMKETPISKGGGGGGQRENPLSTVYPPFFSGDEIQASFWQRGFAFPFVWALIHWKKGGRRSGGCEKKEQECVSAAAAASPSFLTVILCAVSGFSSQGCGIRPNAGQILGAGDVTGYIKIAPKNYQHS